MGNRTVTVAGHYKSMTQESIADGIKVIVDGHEVVVAEDQLTVDGKAADPRAGPGRHGLCERGREGPVKVVHEDETAGQEASEEAPE